MRNIPTVAGIGLLFLLSPADEIENESNQLEIIQDNDMILAGAGRGVTVWKP